MIKSDSVCFYQADNREDSVHTGANISGEIRPGGRARTRNARCVLHQFKTLFQKMPHPGILRPLACLYLERSRQVMKQAGGRKNNAFDGWASKSLASGGPLLWVLGRYGSCRVVRRRAGWGPRKLPDSSRLARRPDHLGRWQRITEVEGERRRRRRCPPGDSSNPACCSRGKCRSLVVLNLM